MDTNSYIVFLLLGVLLVVIDGQIIYRSGRQYLEHSYSDPAAAVSVTRLITVLFHLAVLGVLLLISTIEVGSNPAEGVVLRLGIVLLLLAVAHGITITILNRIRDRLQQERMLEEHNAHQHREPTVQPTVQPVVDSPRPFPAP
jgi:hypothetical protein